MNKTTFILFSFLFALLFFSKNSAYASVVEEEYTVNTSFWRVQSYAPELYLQPYFNLKKPLTLTLANCGIQVLPFSEGFNTASTTFNCWTLIDNNQDQLPAGTNAWRQFNVLPYEGDRVMFFQSPAATLINDDWLVSPTVKMTGGIYAITYYYKTTAQNDNEFEVLLSKDGITPVDFKTVIEPSAKRNTTAYVKKVLHVQNIVGDVNIAWHVMSKGITNVYIDLVSIVEVSCIAPDDTVLISNLEKDKATFSWTDTNNSSWEYYAQPMGAGNAPVGSGIIAPKTSITITKTNGVGGANLQPNTWYEFFVRSSCGVGKNSLWLGPIRFKTPCISASLPFWEGFNKDSKSLDCWAIVDNNKDSTSPTGSNIFRPYNVGMFEGDQAMYFNGTATSTHDDWLISPTFNLDATKFYRLKYHYKTHATNKCDFEVLLSRNGISIGDFTKTLIAKKGHSDAVWAEETIVIGGIAGDINIGWHVTTDKSLTYLSIDNVFLEEIVGCPEPMDLKTKEEKETSATILWTDDFGSNWEYVVQQEGVGLPVAKGTATNKKENIVTQEQSGANLKANTVYEFYVRMLCANGVYSVWSGPYKFQTSCGVFPTPFWEGFNFASPSLGCWTVIDGNGDAVSATSPNIWKTTSIRYEGTHSMFFYGATTDNTKLPHNDWLISPRIKFELGKNYRLKYHYRTETTQANTYEFEVLASNSGADSKNFTSVIVPKKQYKPSSEWIEEYVLITGVSGEINLGWHVTAPSSTTYLYVDNIFVEEVTGCPEPMELGVKDMDINRVTITWTDDFKATAWEYVLQAAGQGVPTVKGVPTNSKENIVSKEQSGKGLEPNVDYEFYVRTVCANGAYSIWSGPFKFSTGCSVYAAPFWEGFNTDSKTARCWTVVDKTGTAIPQGTSWKTTANTSEGNQAVFFNLFNAPSDNFNDWLISPTITLDGGMYVLKYDFRTIVETDNNEFEVLLSTQGKDISKFTTVVVPSKKHGIDKYQEEVVFIDGVKGDVNLAWHVNSKNASVSYLYLDNVSLKKVENCPDPYYVKTSNQTTTSIDLEWKQDGGIANWEVIVVDYGQDATATPVKTVAVTANPKTTISGLDPAKGYTIYVRAKCADGKTHSDWSTPVKEATKVDANDDCMGALTIPVNNTLECLKTLSGSLLGATPSTVVTPSCLSSLVKDVWFEFTATANTHLLGMKDLASISDNRNTLYIAAAVYDQPCAAITNATVACFTFTPTNTEIVLTALTPGKKYYVRLGVGSAVVPDFVFKLCITTSVQTPPLVVSPSGDQYTVEELVKDVLVKSNCDLVSNIKYQVGNGTAVTQSINALGYFNKNGSIFPFEEGIVLGTSEVKFVPGPHKGANSARGSNPNRWAGDKDINAAIYDAGGGPLAEKRVTQLEFDFVPVKETLKFEYLFASNSYVNGCTYMCDTGALFAAWLVDTTTGEGQNLAKIKGTNTPIALNTIRDASKSGVYCGSANPEYYWKHYDNNQDSPIEAPIDFVGMTKAMESETVVVVPGRKYHIKLAVMDFCTTNSHTSAVFFNAGSFDLGALDLGTDMLIESENALCKGATSIIKSGLGKEDITIQWYKDGIAIPGADTPDLEVSETGNYKVIGTYDAINCEVMGTKKVEIYPDLSDLVAAPETLSVCRNSLKPILLDLTAVENAMLSNVTAADFAFVYYKTKAAAEAGIDAVASPQAYEFEYQGPQTSFYIDLTNTRTGCSEIFILPVQVLDGEFPSSRPDVKVCESYTLPELQNNQYYYSKSAAQGVNYQAGERLNQAGQYTIYVLQRNNDQGCYEEISFQITITEPVKAAVFEDIELECEFYQLEPLPAHNKYFTESEGRGVELAEGSLVPFAQKIYVYAASADGQCTDESSFKVSYKECPIPKGISPNGDGINDRFDLSKHGVSSLIVYNRYGAEVYSFQGAYTDQWYGQGKGDKALPDGTYFYVVLSYGTTKSGWVQINR